MLGPSSDTVISYSYLPSLARDAASKTSTHPLSLVSLKAPNAWVLPNIRKDPKLENPCLTDIMRTLVHALYLWNFPCPQTWEAWFLLHGSAHWLLVSRFLKITGLLLPKDFLLALPINGLKWELHSREPQECSRNFIGTYGPRWVYSDCIPTRFLGLPTLGFPF